MVGICALFLIFGFGPVAADKQLNLAGMLQRSLLAVPITSASSGILAERSGIVNISI